MKFKFIGDPSYAKDDWKGSNNPSVTTFGEYRFPINEAVEVKDERLITKLQNNKHFEVVEDKPKVTKAKAPAKKATNGENK